MAELMPISRDFGAMFSLWALWAWCPKTRTDGDITRGGVGEQQVWMSMPLPVHFLMVIFAGWVNRKQQAVIEYLQAENEVLKSQLKGRRITLSDDDRRKLAVKGKALGRKLLSEVACIVTPDTIPAWHRRACANTRRGLSALRLSWNPIWRRW